MLSLRSGSPFWGLGPWGFIFKANTTNLDDLISACLLPPVVGSHVLQGAIPFTELTAPKPKDQESTVMSLPQRHHGPKPPKILPKPGFSSPAVQHPLNQPALETAPFLRFLPQGTPQFKANQAIPAGKNRTLTIKRGGVELPARQEKPKLSNSWANISWESKGHVSQEIRPV